MKNKTLGYSFTLLAVAIFAAQDGISKYLASYYSPIFIAMVRYWVFGIFVLLIAARSGGIVKTLYTKRPFLQICRGVLLAVEIVIFIFGLSRIGMATAQSIFQVSPLLITMLSVPFLGEKVGWRRWAAIFVGLFGVLIIINPTTTQFNINIVFPLIATVMYAVYSVATRAVSRTDSPTTSFVYIGLVGAIVLTAVGSFQIVSIARADWFWMSALCICGMSSHYCMIRAYDILEAGEVQPLTYLQLVIGAFIAVLVYQETLTWNLILGACIVVSAGLFSMFRERHLSKERERL